MHSLSILSICSFWLLTPRLAKASRSGEGGASGLSR